MLPRKSTPSLWLKLALVFLALVTVVILLIRGTDVFALVHDGITRLREAGPLVFFSALAVLPAFGVPVSPFYLTAGVAFNPAIAIPATLGAIAANVSLVYLLSGYLLRPTIESLMKRFGREVPEIKKENTIRMILVVRLAPGLPFSVQSYLLGLARVSFGWYLLLTVAIQGLIATSVILFGDALFKGSGGKIFTGIMLVIVAILIVQWLRKSYGSRNDKTA